MYKMYKNYESYENYKITNYYLMEIKLLKL